MFAGSLGWDTLKRKVEEGTFSGVCGTRTWNGIRLGREAGLGENHSKGWGWAEVGAQARRFGWETLSLHFYSAGTDFASQIQILEWCSLFFCSLFEEKLARFAFSFFNAVRSLNVKWVPVMHMALFSVYCPTVPWFGTFGHFQFPPSTNDLICDKEFESYGDKVKLI